MSTPALKITVDDKALREALAKLPERLNERARKNGARRALAPFAKSLGRIWAASRYRGKATHRKAIQAAAQMDVRRIGRGPLAPLRSQVGIRYGSKGGARAKGRQRVYHLLELGFRHYGRGSSFYSSTPAHLVQQRDARKEFVKLERDRIWKESPGGSRQARQARSAALFVMYGQAREQFKELSDFRFSKASAMKAAGGGAKKIPGAMRSYRWAVRALPIAMRRMAEETLAEAKKLLGGAK